MSPVGVKGTSKNSFAAKIALILRNSALFKVANIINIRHFSRLLPLISQILYEGSLSLSAKRKCSCFLLDQFDFVSRKPISRGALNTIVLLIVIAIVVIGVISIYNSRVKLRNNRENAFADIMADAGGAALTKKPWALASALRKIAGNAAVQNVEQESVQQLFIEH